MIIFLNRQFGADLCVAKLWQFCAIGHGAFVVGLLWMLVQVPENQSSALNKSMKDNIANQKLSTQRKESISHM